MPRNSSLQLQQEADIKAAYQKLKQQKKYTTEYILEKLSKKFFLMPSTIWRISWGEYDTNRQRAAAKAPEKRASTRRKAAKHTDSSVRLRA